MPVPSTRIPSCEVLARGRDRLGEWRRYKNKGNGGAGCGAGQEATPGYSEESAEARDPPARSDLDADRPEASCENEERPGMDDLDHSFYPPAKRSGLRPLANEARSRDH